MALCERSSYFICENFPSYSELRGLICVIPFPNRFNLCFCCCFYVCFEEDSLLADSIQENATLLNYYVLDFIDELYFAVSLYTFEILFFKLDSQNL